MRVLAVGAGGVGTSAALIAARRGFFEKWVVSDYDVARAEAVVDRLQDDRFVAAQVDASDADARQNLLAGINNWSVECCRQRRATNGLGVRCRRGRDRWQRSPCRGLPPNSCWCRGRSSHRGWVR